MLNITSAQARHGKVFVATYPVANLVIPIPNFSPHGGMGLEGAYQRALAATTSGNISGMASGDAAPISVVASRDPRSASGMLDRGVMADMASASRGGIPGAMPAGGGQGNLGGNGMADFDTLIQLIENEVEPDSWADNGGTGQGQISSFPINLSLVINNTQEVHDKIVDLLEQLRHMQDLQVTIEVRFITLNDTFFERIGVNFNWQINDNIDHTGMVFGAMTAPGTPGTPGTKPTRDTRTGIFKEFGAESSVTVGFTPNNTFTADLDIPFSQNSFGLTVPQLSSFDPSAGLDYRFRHPQRHRGDLLDQCRPVGPADQRPPGPQGHAVQRPAGGRLRHVAEPVRHERNPLRGRFRGGTAAGDRRPERRDVPHRPGGGFRRADASCD